VGEILNIKRQISNNIKNQRSKIKMAAQNVKLLIFALSFCTFIFTFCILKGFEAGRPCHLDFYIWVLSEEATGQPSQTMVYYREAE